MTNSTLAAWITASVLLGSAPGISRADTTALDTSHQQTQHALTQYKQSRQNYLANVKQYGKDSPQAQEARVRRDRDHQAWQNQRSELHRQRYAAHAKHQHIQPPSQTTLK